MVKETSPSPHISSRITEETKGDLKLTDYFPTSDFWKKYKRREVNDNQLQNGLTILLSRMKKNVVLPSELNSTLPVTLAGVQGRFSDVFFGDEIHTRNCGFLYWVPQY